MPADRAATGGAPTGESIDHEWLWCRQTTGPPAVSVVAAVAELEEVEMAALPPLYDAVDPEALNALFPETDDRRAERVRFRYCGYLIAVGPSVIRIRSTD